MAESMKMPCVFQSLATILAVEKTSLGRVNTGAMPLL